MLTKEQILQANDKRVEKVECPEWNGFVFIRSLTADQRDSYEQSLADAKTVIGARAKLVAACMCDKDGKTVQWTPAEVEALGRKSAAVVDRIADRCMVINGMRAEDVEAAEKNSEKADVSVSG